MRKIFFLLLCSVCFLACNNSRDGRLNTTSDSTDQDDNMSGKTGEVRDFPMLDTGKAKQMIRHYLDENVDHKLNSVVKSISFEKREITDFLNMKHVVGIKFLAAAYLETDPRKNMPTIIVQLKKRHNKDSSYVYFDVNIQSFKHVQSVLCPPPDDCIMNIEN